MRKALRKVTGTGKSPKVEIDIVDETMSSQSDSELEEENVEEEKSEEAWESIMRERR